LKFGQAPRKWLVGFLKGETRKNELIYFSLTLLKAVSPSADVSQDLL